MNIIIGAARAAPYLGGSEKSIDRLSAELSDRGHSVCVVSCCDRDVAAGETTDERGIRHVRIPQPVAGVRDIPPAAFARTVLTEARRADAVHLFQYHQPHAAWAGHLLARAGVPYVISTYYHGTGHSRLASLAHIPWRPIGRRLLRNAAAVIAITDAEAAQLREHFGVEPVIIPVGTDPVGDGTPEDREHGVPQVLSVGRMEAYKRNDSLLRAAAALPQGVACELVFAGEGPQRAELEDMATRLGVRARFLGRVSDDDLMGWRRRAQVHAQLSEKESFGMSLAEALTTRGNILASDIPAHRDVARLAGAEQQVAWVPPGGDAAAALVAALSRPRPSAHRHLPGWDEVADRMVEAYTQLAMRQGSEVPAAPPV